MGNNTKKWKALAAEVQTQNEQPYVKGLRFFIRISHFLDKYISANLCIHGLNQTQIRILIFTVAQVRPVTPTELSKITYLTLDTINKSVDNLDKMGLTRSYRSRKDRRVRKVTLTEKGLDLIEKHLPLRHEVFSNFMSCFSDLEIKTFSDYLERIIDSTGMDKNGPA